MGRLEILYNAVCPVCRAGACDLEQRAALAKADVVLTDVSQNADALRRAGVTLDQVRLKMHAIDENGRVLAGMPAVALAWARDAALSAARARDADPAPQLDRRGGLSFLGPSSMGLE